MRVLVYFEGQEKIARSGIGRAMEHQLRALESAGVETVTDPEGWDFDLAHVNTYWPKSQHVLRRAKARGIPVIVHGHSTYEDFRESFRLWKLAYPFYKSFLRSMYRRADMVIAPTEYAADLIRGHGFCNNVLAVSNGISLSDYAPCPEARKEFRRLFKLGEREPYVMGVGFPFVRKGILEFIETARLMPDVRFLWFGSLERILTQPRVLKAMESAPKNCLFPGYLKGELIRGGYQGAAALLFPTHEETEGIVALEALASSTPLIVRNIPVFRGWLKGGESCLQGETPAEFASIIRNLIEKGPPEGLLENGRRIAEERDLPLIGMRLRECYLRLLGSST